jgi:Inclusion body protein
MAFIDIAIVFDTARITTVKGGTTPGAPTGLNHQSNAVYDQWAFMLVNSTHLDPKHLETQATANLFVIAHPNDSIRWRAESLSDNTVNAVIIYKILPNNPDHPNILSAPEVNVQSLSIPVPNVNDPTTYKVENQTSGNVTASVNSAGTYPYFVYFYIVSRDANSGDLGAPQYYYWDPTVTVTSS